ncbi:MAG: TRAP transporter permease [Inquilinaceae bacterium]
MDTARAIIARKIGQRSPAAWLGLAVFALAIGIAAVHIWFNTFANWSVLWTSTIHFASLGALCALLIPLVPLEGKGGRRLVLIVDLALAALLVAAVVYVLITERALALRGFDYNFWDYAAGLTLVILAVEFTRRTTGWIIPVLIVLAFTYIVWWGRYVPSLFQFPGLSLEVVLLRSVYGEDGMFGMIARISSSFVFMFILFGAFLVKSGAGAFIIDLARAVAGRMVGGPGFVAVLGSGLTGTISGSAVANTVSTGVITIPLMKRAGFPARFAAGVEASASTGGQLMPPIMGAGVFVMVNFTQIPYLDIVAVSFLPAVMYFLGIAFYVRIEAKKQGLTAEAADDAPRLGAVMRRGGAVFLIPLTVLVGMLVLNYTPTFAATFAILAVIASSWLTPHRMGPREILDALAMGVHNMILTGILLVSVGLIVNVIATAGIGNTFSLMMSSWAGGNLFIAIVLVAIASLVLGMGLPVTAAYIVLAALSAPALYDLIIQSELVNAVAAGTVPDAARAVLMLVAPDSAGALGQPMSTADAASLVALIPPDMASMVNEATLSPAVLTTALLSAHMIIFWLSQDSNVTPPVCLTAFAAAAIAGTKPMATGMTAWKIAKVLYIVPLLFAYTPFLSGDFGVAIQIFGFGTLGIYALVAAIEGHAESPISWLERPLIAAIGVALLWPNSLMVHLVGTVLIIAFMAWNIRRGRHRRLAGA